MNRPTAVSSALGFTAGYVDTFCFVALFGLFTAHVTGNFVLLGNELAKPGHNVLIKLLAFPAFIGAVAVARVVASAVERRSGAVARALLLLQIVLLLGCMVCSWAARPIVDSSAPWSLATGLLAAAAMGVQNGAAKLAFSELAPTTMMTGNVTQLVIDIVDLVGGKADEAVRKRIQKLLWPMLAFAVGAVCGGLAFTHIAVWALVLPLALLSMLAASAA